MTLDVNAAKRAGYSDAEIAAFTAKQQPIVERPTALGSIDVEAAKNAGYTEKEIQEFIKNSSLSKTRSLVSAPIKGLIKGTQQLSEIADPIKMVINAFAPDKKVLERATEQVLPTRDELAEQVLERTGKILPMVVGENPLAALAQLAGGVVAGQTAKAFDAGEMGQGVAEAVGMGIPSLVKAGAKKIMGTIKAPAETMVSGLTKPRAIGAKLAERAIIEPQRQATAISKLNEEATSLAKSVVYKELPLAQQIEQGIDFESQFQKQFGDLEKTANKANPQIDISPLSGFMKNATKKFRGVPEPHTEAKKIIKEVDAFGDSPPFELKRLLRTYRSNNKKIKGIFETSRLTGKQQEYVDFLLDYNRNISKSIENTLPKDSAWVKQFKEANIAYKQYRDTLKTYTTLEPILEQKLTPTSLKKFAQDKRLQKKLALSMGDKGASEITQIAQDLYAAESALRKIPAKEIKDWDVILPLTVAVPGFHIQGTIVGAKKYLDWAKRGYGWFLSTPARRNAYQSALKAIRDQNLPMYKKAAVELQSAFQTNED
jgi:hypothetical protein